MADVLGQRSNILANRLRRWIVVTGYVLGAWAIFKTVLNFLAWRQLALGQLLSDVYFRLEVLTHVYRGGALLYLVSPFLLVGGCWGFQRQRRWARPVLFAYAGTWIGGLLTTQGASFLATLWDAYGRSGFWQYSTLALRDLDPLVYASVYPVSLVLYLTRADVRGQSPESRTGFAPVMESARR